MEVASYFMSLFSFSCCQHYLIVKPQPKYPYTNSTAICGICVMDVFIQQIFIECQCCVKHGGGDIALLENQTNVKCSLSSIPYFSIIFSLLPFPIYLLSSLTPQLLRI